MLSTYFILKKALFWAAHAAQRQFLYVDISWAFVTLFERYKTVERDFFSRFFLALKLFITTAF